MIMQPSRIWQLVSCLLVVSFATAQPLRADIVILDDFSTPIQFNNGSFTGPAGSYFWSPEVVIAAGAKATWYDSGSGILGGRRNVEAQNAANSNQDSIICIDNYLSVNSPAANFMCATCLSYTFAALNVDFYHKFVIDVQSLDPVARGNIQGSLTLKDAAGNAAVANFSGSSLNLGRNKIELRGMQNWTGINRQNVVFAEMSFMTTTPAVDFTIDAIAFATNPEPSTFVIMGLGFAAAATVHFRRRFKSRQSD